MLLQIFFSRRKVNGKYTGRDGTTLRLSYQDTNLNKVTNGTYDGTNGTTHGTNGTSDGTSGITHGTNGTTHGIDGH